MNSFAALAVNLEKRLVTVDGVPVCLTSKEYEILELLSLRKGTILTKEMFLNLALCERYPALLCCEI
jgi:DNA-binding response OmpR family regulator